MILKFPAVCLNPFLTKFLAYAPLAIISLESPLKVVSGAAISFHR